MWLRGGSISRIARDKSGASAIEMALVFPLFLIVLLGIVAYGIYFGAAHSVQQLAADAARASVAGLNSQERVTLTETYIANNASKYALLDPDNISITAAPSSSNANDFVVTVSYDASQLPIWNLASFVPLPAQRIERVSVIRRGGA
jgi:Flp pilus assembly protein TadG